MNNPLILARVLQITHTPASMISGDPIAETKFGRNTRPAMAQTNTIGYKALGKIHTDDRADQLNDPQRHHKRSRAEIYHRDGFRSKPPQTTIFCAKVQ